MSIDVGGAPRVSRSANGPLLDNRSPNTLLAAGQARAAEVTNFIEGLTKVATPLIKDALTKQANQQVGELLQTQDIGELIRKTPEERRPLLRVLSPEAQDKANAAFADYATTQYAQIKQAEITKRSNILLSDTTSQEEKAKAAAEAHSIALQQSGLTNLPAANLASKADTLARIDGDINGRTYQGQLETQDKTLLEKERKGRRTFFQAWAAGRVERLTALAGATDEAGQARATEDIKAFTGQFQTAMNQQYNELSRTYGKDKAAVLLIESLTDEVTDLLGSNQADKADILLGLVETAVTGGVAITETGAEWRDYKLPGGGSVNSQLGRLREAVESGREKWEQEEGFRLAGGLIKSAATTGEWRGEEWNALVGQLTPKQIMTLMPALNQLGNIAGQPTQQQEKNLTLLRLRLRNMTPDQQEKAIVGAANSGQITWSQAAGQSAGVGKTEPLLDKLATQSAQINKELVAKGGQLAASLGLTEQERADYITSFIADVTSGTEKRLRAKIKSGELKESDLTDERVRDELRNDMNAATDRRLKDPIEKERARQAQSPANQMVGALDYMQGQLVKSGGVWQQATFPTWIQQQYRQRNPGKPMTADNLFQFTTDLMKNAGLDSNNQPHFKDPAGMLRQLQKQVEQEKKQGQSALQRYTGDMGGLLRNSPLGVLLEKVGIGAPAKAEPAADAAKPAAPAAKPAAQKPQQNPLAMAAGKGLELVAGVIAPPAKAQEPLIINEQNMELLAAQWRRPATPSTAMTTAPLPQVVATAPTQMLPMRIATDQHPIFVAIGIAEGTRTPNGGYTKAYYGHGDPGDGHWNRGTVSGGRGSSASPAQVDRQWMARLTQQAVSAAPVLQRLGLQPGTQGWNRVLFNVLDLTVQAPAAVRDFIAKLPGVVRQGATVEAIAKARSDSFYNPRTGTLDTSFGSYNRLYQDQRSRAGVWDYRRRI
jgi:hypothetical protein